MPVNTRSSNVDKHPGNVDLPSDDDSDSSKSSKRGRKGKANAKRQKKAQKEAEEGARAEEKAEAKLALAKLEIQFEDETERDKAKYPRSRKTRRSEPNTDGELEQPQKKRQKDMEGGDMDIDVHLPKEGSDGSCADNMDGIEDTVQASTLGSTATDKSRCESEELPSLTSSDAEKTPKKVSSKRQLVGNAEGNKQHAVKPRPVHKKPLEEVESGDQIEEIMSSGNEDAAADMTNEERTPKAMSKTRSLRHPSRTAMLGDATALFDSDNEVPHIEGSKTPARTNKGRTAMDNDTPTDNEAEQTTPTKATKGTGRRLKREGAVILSNDNAGDIQERQASNFLEKIKSKHTKPGSESRKDRNHKKHDQGSPDADAMTSSSKAMGRAPNANQRNMKHRSFSESEKSQSELPESPVKARHHKEKKKLEEAQKEIEKLKKQLREREKEEQRAISDPKTDKTRQRETGKAKPNGSNSSLPAFEEDQEVERQAMLSSPLKKGKHVTSESLVTVEKKGAPKLPGEKCSAKVKEEVDSRAANKAKDNGGQKDAKVRPRPAHRVPSRQSKPVDKSEDVSDQDDWYVESKLDAHGKRSAKSTQGANSDVDEVESCSDEADTKPDSKGRRKRPTNGANLPDAVKDDNVTWRVTILGAYRAHIACTDEVWVVNDGTALRHLQIIWDFYMKKKQSHKFVANDPVLPLLRQKASDWRHKIGDAALQALRKYFDQNGLDSIAVRNAAVDVLLDSKNFVYKHLTMNDEGEVADRRGPFCSQLILHTFAVHLSMLNGKSYEFPGLPPPETPIAAMALATTSV